jgi:hypothetical protein
MALIGDRDREKAVELLRRHYLRGRLTLEELTERVELALRARRESEMRLALAELPSARREGGLEPVWRAARRAAFVVAVWSLWWAASLVLMIGFVASVVVQGLSLANGLAFPALWLVCTLAARRATRR